MRKTRKGESKNLLPMGDGVFNARTAGIEGKAGGKGAFLSNTQ